MPRGKVDFFNDTDGYGFIESDDADDDVFFHMEDIDGPDLEEGQKVDFTIEQSPKGPRAENVTRLEGPGAVGPENVQGEVAFFNDTGGYGFIDADGVEDHVFFHMEDISGPDLAEGEAVTFDVEFSEVGPRASNLVRGHKLSTPFGWIRKDQKSNADETDGRTDTGTDIYGGESDDSSDTNIYEPSGDDGSGTNIYEPDSNDRPSFCPQCGTALDTYIDPNFCPDCGSSV